MANKKIIKRNRKDWSAIYYTKNKDRIKSVSKKWRDKNKEKIKEKTLKYYYANKEASFERVKKYTKKLREIILNHYGWSCNCPNCPEKNPIFLTIDHINNDGYKDKMQSGYRFGGANLYRKIIKENFPDNLQILCWNCNCGKRSNNGICPHINSNLEKNI